MNPDEIAKKVKEEWEKRTTLWLNDRLNDFTVTLSPVSSVVEWEAFKMELMEIFGISETEMVNKWPVVYRGNSGESLCNMEEWATLGDNPVKTYDSMIGVCREAIKQKYPKLTVSDRDLLWLMRHAGLPSPLLDFSKSFYVALWFAIHKPDGSIRNSDASVWVVRITDEINPAEVPNDTPLDCNIRPYVYNQVVYDENGETAYYRPASQESIVIRQRFITEDQGGKPRILLLNQDPYFAGKIVRIPIVGDYTEIEKDVTCMLLKDNENYGVYRYRDDPFGLSQQAFYQMLLLAGKSVLDMRANRISEDMRAGAIYLNNIGDV